MSKIHLFAVNLPPADLAKILLRPGGEAEIMQRLLGQAALDPSMVELFVVKDLAEIGLAGYLADGHGIEDDEIAPHKARLAALDGYALILHQSAFDDPTANLNIGADLTPIAQFSKPKVDWSDAEPLHSEAAQGSVAPAKKTPSDAAMSGRIAMIALLVLFALTALMVWVAG
jgi:hypothetical protein